MISSDLCNATKKVLDTFSFHRHFILWQVVRPLFEFLFQSQCNGNLSLSSVIFRYPTRRDYKVLSNFDLTVHSGHTVALVGSSGCGKTTIFSLISRLYDVNVGNVVGNFFFSNAIMMILLQVFSPSINKVNNEGSIVSEI